MVRHFRYSFSSDSDHQKMPGSSTAQTATDLGPQRRAVLKDICRVCITDSMTMWPVWQSKKQLFVQLRCLCARKKTHTIDIHQTHITWECAELPPSRRQEWYEPIPVLSSLIDTVYFCTSNCIQCCHLCCSCMSKPSLLITCFQVFGQGVIAALNNAVLWLKGGLAVNGKLLENWSIKLS
jgi:hypothetical protein